MTPASARFRLVALALLFLAGSACSRNGTIAARRVTQIRKDFPCADSRHVAMSAADRAKFPMACSLVELALQQVASGAAERFGVAGADTARVRAATLHEIRFRCLHCTPDEWYWIVTLTIEGKERSLDVYVEELTSTVRMVPTEG